MKSLRPCVGVLVILLSLWKGTTWAAGSTSYGLQATSPNDASGNAGASTHYQLHDAGITWYRGPLASADYQLLPVTNADGTTASSSSSHSVSSASSVSSSSSSGQEPGNRRPRPSSSSSFSSVSSSFSASRSAIPAWHTAAGTSSSTSIPEAPTPPSGVAGRGWGLHTYHFFDAVEEPCPETATVAAMHAAAPAIGTPWAVLLVMLCTLGLPWLLCAIETQRRGHRSPVRRAVRRRAGQTMAVRILVLLVVGAGIVRGASTADTAHAIQTTPGTYIYNGRLLTSTGTPVTTPHTIRFSEWTSADMQSGDANPDGSINTSAPAYAGWQEAHTVTPNASGYFSVALGSSTPLPDLATMPVASLLALHLQVDVKQSADPATSYELLDVDPTDPAVDRSGVLSVPFAQNADLVDQHGIGTASGSIAVLGPGGTFTTSVIPGGTDAETFTINADDTSTGSIILQFGSTLGALLSYSITNQTFTFSKNLAVRGNLTVTGLINGVDISSLQGSVDALRVASGGGLRINVVAGGYRLNGTITNYPGGTTNVPANTTSSVYFSSGGLIVNTSGFPSGTSFIPLATVVTSAGAVTSVTDRRVLQSDDRERQVQRTFVPAYEGAAYQADGSENVGQLQISHDDVSHRNYYAWTSTRPTLQDYDIVLRIPIPEDFIRWRQGGGVHPITLDYRSLSAQPTANALAVSLLDTNGNAVTLSGATTSLASTGWTTTSIDFLGTPVWTPRQEMVLRLKVAAKDLAAMHVGTLRLNSVDLTPQQ